MQTTNKLTPSQKKWFDSISSLKNKIVSFDHLTSWGSAVFSVEDDDKWATAVVGKRGHFEYSEVTMKVKE